jgi:hypothetical protein
LEAVPGKHSIDSLQKTAILGTSHIIRKVLQCEAWSPSGGDHCWFKRITRKNRPVTREIIIIIKGHPPRMLTFMMMVLVFTVITMMMIMVTIFSDNSVKVLKKLYVTLLCRFWSFWTVFERLTELLNCQNTWKCCHVSYSLLLRYKRRFISGSAPFVTCCYHISPLFRSHGNT